MGGSSVSSGITASESGYTGPIKNNESPQLDLMSQLRMLQQYKGGQNSLEQKPQSSNPYQQMQDGRYQNALSQPTVSMPTQQAPNSGGISGQVQQGIGGK